MNKKPLTPKMHAIMDYALIGSMLSLPSVLGLDKSIKKIYALEALLLLPYVALTRQPLSVKGLIPLKTHRKVDVINVTQFLAQTMIGPFMKSSKARTFNLALTAIAGLTVLLTDWDSEE